MFVAAGTGFAGIVGGVASIAAGAAIAASDHWSWAAGGSVYVNFHVLFAISMVLRLVSAVLATQIREPSSAGAGVVAAELLLATRVRVRAWQIALSIRRDARSVHEPYPEAIALGPAARDVSNPLAAPARRAA